MCDTLCDTLLAAGHGGVAVWVAADVSEACCSVLSHFFFLKKLEPHAGSEVSSVGVVEVVSVAAEGVSEALSGESDCFSTGYEVQIGVLQQDIVRGELYGVVHHALTALVAWEGGVFGVACIGPSLHPAEGGMRLMVDNAVDECREERLAGGGDSAVVGCMLERDIVPMIVGERLAQGVRLVADGCVVGEEAELVGGGVFQQKRMVLLQRAAAIVQVANHDGLLSGIAERHQLLLHRVPGKTIANTKQTDGVLCSQSLYLH